MTGGSPGSVLAEITVRRVDGCGGRLTARLSRVDGVWLAVAGVTVLAFSVRLATMRDSLLGDDLFMFNIVHGRSLGQALHIVRETEKTPPLLFIIDWFSSRLGDPTYWVRLPSLLCGTALVPLTYALGARAFGRAAGALASALVTLSAFGIFYASESRAYAAVAFFSGLSALCLLYALERDRRGCWVAYGLAALATIYTHYVGLFVVLAEVAWALLAHRERIRTLLIVDGLVALAYIPWLPAFIVQARHSADEGHRLANYVPTSWSRLGLINAQELFGHPFASLHQVPGIAALAGAIAVVCGAGIAALMRAWRTRGLPALSDERVLIALLAVAAPVGVAVVSLRPHESFMLPRNLSSSFVFSAALMAGLVWSLRRPLSYAAAAALVVVMAIGALDALRPQYRRSPYRAVAHYVDAHSPSGDPVIQQFFVPTHGSPLATVLEVNLSHPRVVYDTPAGAALAWRNATHGGTVWIVQDLPGYWKSLMSLPNRNGPGNRFVLVRQDRYVGLDDILAGQYRYVAPVG
jgi:4-amino-4-deoxy-L-arabinose transferase-like glycosyltransferase